MGNQQEKLLIICGPTATGKTALAFSLAKKFDGELLSVDSRQVYKGMPILTGKDIPEGFTLRKSDLVVLGRSVYYWGNGIRLWLTDIFDIKERGSVGLYRRIADCVLRDIRKRQKLPIVVGGTGLYIKALVDNPDKISIPPDQRFRKAKDGTSVQQLQSILSQIDSVKLCAMNDSDRNNPRRLLRAIETSRWEQTHDKNSPRVKSLDILWIGLAAPREVLDRRVKGRIAKRWRSGVVEEVRKMHPEEKSSDTISLTSLGLDIIYEYIKHTITKNDAIDRWYTKESQYVRQQLTWFKKEKRIVWFDVSELGYLEAVAAEVARWYTR